MLQMQLLHVVRSLLQGRGLNCNHLLLGRLGTL